MKKGEKTKKLEKAKPELFDYQDVPELKPNPKYDAALDKLMPQWMKDRLAKSRG